MGAVRPESGLRSKRPKCNKKFLIIVMGAVRPADGLRPKRLKSGTVRFWKRKFAELTGTCARVPADEKD